MFLCKRIVKRKDINKIQVNFVFCNIKRIKENEEKILVQAIDPFKKNYNEKISQFICSIDEYKNKKHKRVYKPKGFNKVFVQEYIFIERIDIDIENGKTYLLNRFPEFYI